MNATIKWLNQIALGCGLDEMEYLTLVLDMSWW